MSDEDLDKLINDNGFGEEPAGSVNDLPNDPKVIEASILRLQNSAA